MSSEVPLYFGSHVLDDHALGSIDQGPVLLHSDIIWVGAIFHSDTIMSGAGGIVGAIRNVRNEIEVELIVKGWVNTISFGFDESGRSRTISSPHLSIASINHLALIQAFVNR